jgi:hypothetical protein
VVFSGDPGSAAGNRPLAAEKFRCTQKAWIKGIRMPAGRIRR